LSATTIPYPAEWRERLSTLEHASAYEYALAHTELGHYLGRLVRQFLEDNSMTAEVVASHGHTIFHQPHLGLTTQIGDGDAIAAECGLPVVSNFRTLDVALGGQGAPLVPIGDRLLFGQYDACLNLGGFSNISYEEPSGSRVAFDVCPCNMALNHLSRMEGLAFDKNGQLARSGTVDKALLAKMNALDYYRRPMPKSLGKEWFVSNFLPLFSSGTYDARTLLRTTVEHIAEQITWAIKGHSISTMLVTGGGAKNKFLLARLQAMIPGCRITVPADDIIDYKEAIIFALLGYLRLQKQNNCLGSVTGARHDNCGGDIAGLSYLKQ
jgi:anhydro-N-acetylmuramic acid kinase